MKKALIIGAGGFIGHNLVNRLKRENWYVVGVDLHEPFFADTGADEFLIADARHCDFSRFLDYDRIYQLAADMGGAGFVFTGDNDSEILSNSVSININLLQQIKGYKGVVFYSSSVCVYASEVTQYRAEEKEAYPANPDSNYGWEKLYSEKLFQAYAKNHGIDIRIARFNNTYGPHGVFKGGREKSPAAICRKVLLADPVVEIWGDGKQIREFVYIDDLLGAIEIIVNSDVTEPLNIGPSEFTNINNLIEMAREVEGKEIEINYVDGPIGLQTRITDNKKITKLGWKPQVSLREGIKKTYLWIKEQYGKRN